ncbi:hypothetical protein KY331_03175 [Candidatus Woesearchaeota archaeon]|nr:hypothetical protein [Candidatus Woesearchaeota archaeon]
MVLITIILLSIIGFFYLQHIAEDVGDKCILDCESLGYEYHRLVTTNKDICICKLNSTHLIEIKIHSTSEAL